MKGKTTQIQTTNGSSCSQVVRKLAIGTPRLSKNSYCTLERFFSGTLESNSSDVTGLTLHAHTFIQKNATLV